MRETLDRYTVDSVFIGGPFLSLIDPATGLMSAQDQLRFSKLIDVFEDAGREVFNAHRREGWGRDLMPPEQCSQLDFEGLAACDLFVAFPGSPASPGTHVEIGWATAMRKPTLLLLEDGEYYTFLVTGLPAWAGVRTVRYTGTLGFLDGLEDEVARVLAAATGPERRVPIPEFGAGVL
jgi:nucleoside 2-deoxyribosyltransferase